MVARETVFVADKSCENFSVLDFEVCFDNFPAASDGDSDAQTFAPINKDFPSFRQLCRCKGAYPLQNVATDLALLRA